jgi:hypothetical protein
MGGEKKKHRESHVKMTIRLGTSVARLALSISAHSEALAYPVPGGSLLHWLGAPL